MRKPIEAFFCVLAVCCIVSCSSSARKTQWYTLHPGAFEQVSEQGNMTFSSFGVGPIVLPESLKRRELVVFTDGNQIIMDSSHLWAGDLKRAISRVVASNIGDMSGRQDVWPYPWDVRTRPEGQLSLIIEQLGGPLSGPVLLKAQWKLLIDSGQSLAKTGLCEISVSVESPSYEDYVSAFNEVINECSKEVYTSVASH